MAAPRRWQRLEVYEEEKILKILKRLENIFGKRLE